MRLENLDPTTRRVLIERAVARGYDYEHDGYPKPFVHRDRIHVSLTVEGMMRTVGLLPEEDRSDELGR